MAERKDQILEELRRIVAETGEVVGVRRFEKLTGILEHTWRGRFWRTWSDVVIEAGFKPNTVTERHRPEPLLLRLIELTRTLRRFPLEVDLRLAREADPSFPSVKGFYKLFGKQPARLAALRAFVAEREEYTDVADLLPQVATDEVPRETDNDEELVEGHVYLLLLRMRAGKRYKIGRTEAVPRRHRQVALELPEKPDVVHVINTDDPVGIEAYWHNRFASKRTNGEWFSLSVEDVRAFKRRKFM